MKAFNSLRSQNSLLGLHYFALLSVFTHLVTADWQYKSRPDLSPPILNITIPAAQEVSLGYIFIAPYSGVPWSDTNAHGPIQPGPYIFTRHGELIWSGFGYFSGWATNFQAGKWKGKDILFAFEGAKNTRHGHSHGHVKILDERYETIREIRSGNYNLLDLHEFHVVDSKTALVESYHPLPYDLKPYGTRPVSQWIVDARFQELDIETGSLLFEWKSLEHVLPDETVWPISGLQFGTGHNSSDAIDYFHINSVDRDSESNYLISSRHTSTIFKINGTSGEIIWRLGGKYSNFTLESGVEFGFQHHARYISKDFDENTEIISLFDNAGSRFGGNNGEYGPKSSGKLLALNTKTWTATLLQSFPAPDSIFAFSQGSTQILPNGNAFTNWGSGGAVTEFSSNGTVLFHAYLESGELWRNGDVQNYRGFKFNWTGVPNEEPAVVALRHGESTVVYVSWNGDTETENWRFYGIEDKGEIKLLGVSKRAGFETDFYVKNGGGKWVGFVVESVGGNGEVLRTSAVAKSQEYVPKYVPGRDGFMGQANEQQQLSKEHLDGEY